MNKTFKVIEIGKLNLNNRIYDDKAANIIVETFKSKPPKTMLGELEHPNHFDVSLKMVSHMIEDIRIEENWVIADIKILNTPMGKAAKQCIDNLVLSPRSAGTIDENNIVQLKKFFTLDLISKETSAFNIEN